MMGLTIRMGVSKRVHFHSQFLKMIDCKYIRKYITYRRNSSTLLYYTNKYLVIVCFILRVRHVFWFISHIFLFQDEKDKI
jgi:hypothetical protein